MTEADRKQAIAVALATLAYLGASDRRDEMCLRRDDALAIAHALLLAESQDLVRQCAADIHEDPDAILAAIRTPTH